MHNDEASLVARPIELAASGGGEIDGEPRADGGRKTRKKQGCRLVLHAAACNRAVEAGACPRAQGRHNRLAVAASKQASSSPAMSTSVV